MRTIYYKEAPENPESLEVIIKDYFEKESPETYWSDTNELQCDRYKHRSPDDLLLLANHYFPETSIKDLMNAYKSINDEFRKDGRTMIFSFCPDMDKPRLRKLIYRTDDFLDINKGMILFTSDWVDRKGNSKWCLRELAAMIDD